jgi:hypothetical protein
MCRDPGDLVGVVEPAAGGAGEEAWGERVDSDSAGAPLGCEFAGEGEETGFACAIAGQRVAVEADHGGRGGDVHDHAGSACQHVVCDELGQCVEADQVGLEKVAYALLRLGLGRFDGRCRRC